MGKNALGLPIYRKAEGAPVFKYNPFDLYSLSARKIKRIEEHRIKNVPINREDLAAISPQQRELLKSMFGTDIPPLSRIAPHIALLNSAFKEDVLTYVNTYGILKDPIRALPELETIFQQVYSYELAIADSLGYNPELQLFDPPSHAIYFTKLYAGGFLSFILNNVLSTYNIKDKEQHERLAFYLQTIESLTVHEHLDMLIHLGIDNIETIKSFIAEHPKPVAEDSISPLRIHLSPGDTGFVPVIDTYSNLLAACILMVWLDLLEGYSYGMCGQEVGPGTIQSIYDNIFSKEPFQYGCGKWFLKKRLSERFCSAKCSNEASYAKWKQSGRRSKAKPKGGE